LPRSKTVKMSLRNMSGEIKSFKDKASAPRYGKNGKYKVG
jgi:hypothetical protein